jgi:hypothetical protein
MEVCNSLFRDVETAELAPRALPAFFARLSEVSNWSSFHNSLRKHSVYRKVADHYIRPVKFPCLINYFVQMYIDNCLTWPGFSVYANRRHCALHAFAVSVHTLPLVHRPGLSGAFCSIRHVSFIHLYALHDRINSRANTLFNHRRPVASDLNKRHQSRHSSAAHRCIYASRHSKAPHCTLLTLCVLNTTFGVSNSNCQYCSHYARA